MFSFNYFIILVPIIGTVLLAINLILAPHVPYKEKRTPFECGYHSFFQTRLPVEIKHITTALLFMIFDIEIVAIYPYSVSTISNYSFGLIFVVIFIGVLGLGFIYELGKGALTIGSRQDKTSNLFEIDGYKSVKSSAVETLGGMNDYLYYTNWVIKLSDVQYFNVKIPSRTRGNIIKTADFH